ncbi:MAG: hypothetical protein WAU81_07465 [Candidatus Aminicenantales bacterium]
MASRDSLPVALFVTRKKLVSAKANLFILTGFLILPAFIWIKGAFVFSVRLFLFIFPHLFLFLARDMIKDEVDSGALENLLFLDGGYRSYLRWKNAVVGAAALGAGLILFAAFALYGLATRQFAALFLLQFGTGIVAGLYYLALAGFLSFFLRAGTNALLVILGQALGFFGLLLAATQRPEWIERVTPSSLPGLAAQLEFLALAVVFPNVLVAARSWMTILGVGVLAGLFFGLQLLKVRSLELRK